MAVCDQCGQEPCGRYRECLEQRLAAVEKERDELRAHMFNIAVAAVADHRDAFDGQAAVSAVIDVAANRHWLLNEHIPALIAERDELRALVEQHMLPRLDQAEKERDEAETERNALRAGEVSAAATIARLRDEKAALLSVKTTEGYTASEWLMRTAKAEKDRDRYREALHYLRRKIDGYDTTFEFCGVDDFKEAP